jgi:two-component system response regulator AtoC
LRTPHEGTMSTERIYIVDDEETISKLLEMWVGQRWGYTTEIFSDGKSFLDRFIELPDLVLLDLMLPDINGVELLKEIKQRSPELPVIVLSAQGSVEVALQTHRFFKARNCNKKFAKARSLIS